MTTLAQAQAEALAKQREVRIAAETEEFMKLRDMFAAHALQGLVANGKMHCQDIGQPIESFIAQYAYRLADAMIQERMK